MIELSLFDDPDATVAPAAKHFCHADGCLRVVAPKLLMCAKHWRMVPGPLRDAVWESFRPGQEVSKTPSAAYLVASGAAIERVAELEGRR